uniref:Uncharacterized protein n=1 Tax=Glossina brevipalpis TaxID=37001 RepID=A0A1A9WPL1_9MUSC
MVDKQINRRCLPIKYIAPSVASYSQNVYLNDPYGFVNNLNAIPNDIKAFIFKNLIFFLLMAHFDVNIFGIKRRYILDDISLYFVIAHHTYKSSFTQYSIGVPSTHIENS